jgi:hypothetical protein
MNMDKAWAKKFLDLVYSNAPLRAYQKRLGLNKVQVEYHVEHIEHYVRLVDADKKVKELAPPKSIIKIKDKPKPKKVKTYPLKSYEKKKKSKYDGED